MPIENGLNLKTILSYKLLEVKKHNHERSSEDNEKYQIEIKYKNKVLETNKTIRNNFYVEYNRNLFYL